MKLYNIASMLASTSIAFSAFADDHEEKDQLSPFNVIGTKSDVTSLKGSGAVLDSSDLAPFFHTDIHEILRQVPGVYVRGEEGYGFFPNISFRGVDPGRSNKITILEDGVPSAPAPYADPAAYYAPTAGRMAGIEILKGSSSLKYGPNTTGGVINYLSTAIPNEQRSHLRASYGEYNERISHAYSGGKTDFGNGKLGYLLEIFDHRSDGWQKIAGIGNTPERSAPVAKTDLLLKLSYEFGEDSYLEFKAGRMDMDADVSYQGLSKEDFDAKPYMRYPGTHQDNMDAQQERYYLRYKKEFSDSLSLTSTVYQNKFVRNWYKLGKKYYATDNTTAPYATTINTNTNAQNNPENDFLDMLGLAGRDYDAKSNYRTYTTKGIQANLDYLVNNHNFDLGFRYQDDHYIKNSEGTSTADTYLWGSNGAYTFTPGTKKGTDPYKDAEALEIYLTDEIGLGALTIAPGIRYSDIDYSYKGGTTVSLDDVLVGIGASYEISDNLSLFGGVHQGHNFPDAESVADEDMKQEESLNFEIGARGNAGKWMYELVYFNTQLENMLFLASEASGITTSANAGEGSTQGIEVTLATDFGDDSGIGIPFSVSATFTDTEFETGSGTSGTTGDKDAYIFGASKGKVFPYIPDTMFNVRGGLEFTKLSTYLNYHYQSAVFTNAVNDHKIDSYGTLDWSAFYQISEGVKTFAKVTNLTDEVYAPSILPGGYRAGAPRIASIGMEFDF